MARSLWRTARARCERREVYCATVYYFHASCSLGDAPFANTKHVNIYQFQIMGTKAHKVSATLLQSPAHLVLQYFIDGKAIIVPNLQTSASEVLYYKYPEGGVPIATRARNAGARAVVVTHVKS